MNQNTTDQLVLVAFGTFIGLIAGILGRVIYDSIVKDIKRKALLKGIISELKGIKYQCVLITYLVYSRYGLLDRVKINWIHENLLDFRNIDNTNNILSGLEDLQRLTDIQLRYVIQVRRLQADFNQTAQSFKKYRLMFIEQNLNNLDLFSTDIQYKILSIVKKIDRLNQEVDYAITFYTKTFEVESSVNLDAVNRNYDQSAQSIGRWSCQIAKDITEFINNNERMIDVIRFS